MTDETMDEFAEASPTENSADAAPACEADERGAVNLWHKNDDTPANGKLLLVILYKNRDTDTLEERTYRAHREEVWGKFDIFVQELETRVTLDQVFHWAYLEDVLNHLDAVSVEQWERFGKVAP